MVEHQVDPRPRGERGQLLEELQGLEHELAGAIRPRRLQRQHDAAIVEEPQPVLRHRGPEQVASQLFQARAIRGRHLDVSVQIEAREVRVPRHGREHRGGSAPHAPYAAARARTERDAPLDRGAVDSTARG